MMQVQSAADLDLECDKLVYKDGGDNNNEWENTMDTQKAAKMKVKECIYQKAINSLEEYAYPAVIPCREKEKDVIMRFLIDGFEGKGSASTLYISGFPGVGKTIVVRDSIERFKQRNKKRAADFIDIKINAMNLMKPNAIYSSILKQLTGLEISGCKALPTLNSCLSRGVFPKLLHKTVNEFSAREIQRKLKKTKIIFIDEVDYLFTKDQDVLYNIFQWTHSQLSKIVLITTSNTFTFPQQLETKILSRIGSERLNFMTYTSIQIETILTQRLNELNIFQKEGIRLISKKLATTSDMRKCLYILRTCIGKYMEMKKNGECPGQLISMEAINKTLKQMYDNPLINSLKNLPVSQKQVLFGIFDVIKQTGIYCWLSELLVQMKLKQNSSKEALIVKSSADVQECLARLKQLNIIKMLMRQRHNRKSITSKQIPSHVSEFRIELNIQTTALLRAFDLL